jgi:hypothetical protein
LYSYRYRGFESPLPSEEGLRILWIASSQKKDQDIQARQARIDKTIQALDTLKTKVASRRWDPADTMARLKERLLIEIFVLLWNLERLHLLQSVPPISGVFTIPAVLNHLVLGGF